MKHLNFAIAIVAVLLTACENKLPEDRRFPDAQVKFQYREIEPFVVQFRNRSTHNLQGYYWTFDSKNVPSWGFDVSFKNETEHKYKDSIAAYNVHLTCVDNEARLNMPDSVYVDMFNDPIWFYSDSAYVIVTGMPTNDWTYGNEIPAHVLDSLESWGIELPEIEL